MKRVFNILFIFILFIYCVGVADAQTNYYVKTYASGGRDEAGKDGLSLANAWATGAYACSRVSSNGIINISDGTYIETSQWVLKVTVSLKGAGIGTHIVSNFNNGANNNTNVLVYAVSTSEGTNGNQSISDIYFDGNSYYGRGAIYFRFRDNISIYNCTISEFEKAGIYCSSEYDWVTPPTVYSKTLDIYNNIIDDNAIYELNHNECNITVAGYEDFEIYNNIISNDTRVSGRSLYTSQCRDYKIRDNTFNTRYTVNSQWLFSMELFNNRGGVEIMRNRINGFGTIDVAGHSILKGTYAFGIKVYDNEIYGTPIAYNAIPLCAITIEAWVTIESVYVYRNHTKDIPWGINVTMGTYGEWGGNGTIDDLYIYANIIERPAHTDVAWSAFGIAVLAQSTANYRDNINILNNTIIGSTTYSWRGILYQVTGTNTNINIKNNIIIGFTSYGIRIEDDGGTTDDLNIDYNLLYSNGNSNNVSAEAGMTYSNTGHLIDDPEFIGGSPYDYHLSSSSSPAYHSGIDVSLDVDFDEYAWYSTPSRGAYEFDESKGSGGTGQFGSYLKHKAVYNGKYVKY